MTSLTAIFGSSSEGPDEHESESEKLLNLYWNRAELKKEFAELRNEKLRLQERIAEQEGAAARALQKLEQLEGLLLDPAMVYSAVTYFQLRALNMKCTAKLANFAELLKRQREQRVHGRLVAEWTQARSKQVAGIESKLGELRIQAQMLEDRLRAERRRLAAMNGIVRFFRGRSITAGLDKLADNFHRIQENESSLVREIEEIQARSPPDTQGLDTATKRTINLMILAYAQKLYLLLCQHEVADLAKEAGEKGVGALNYGGKQSCDRILEHVRNSLVTLAENRDMADEIKHRAHRIAEHAKFQSADDAVPISTSVATVYDFVSDASVRESKHDLLDGDYWNIGSVVSR